MVRSISCQLDACDALIAELEAAQGAIETGSRSQRVSRERLQALYAERRQLRKDLANGAGTPAGVGRFYSGRFNLPEDR